MPEIARQRPAPASLTHGNVEAFPFWGKYTPETKLSGFLQRLAGNCHAREFVLKRRVLRDQLLTVLA
jgi:hypothetical protein